MLYPDTEGAWAFSPMKQGRDSGGFSRGPFPVPDTQTVKPA